MNVSQLFVSYVSRKMNRPLTLERIKYVVKDPSIAVQITHQTLEVSSDKHPCLAESKDRLSFFLSTSDTRVAEVDAQTNCILRHFAVTSDRVDENPSSAGSLQIFEHHIVESFDLYCTSHGLLIQPRANERAEGSYILFRADAQKQLRRSPVGVVRIGEKVYILFEHAVASIDIKEFTLKLLHNQRDFGTLETITEERLKVLAIHRIAHKLFVLAEGNYIMSIDLHGVTRYLKQDTYPTDGACCLGSASDFLLVGGLDQALNTSWVLICDSQMQPRLLNLAGSSITKSAPRKMRSYRFNKSSLVLIFYDSCVQLMRLAVSKRTAEPCFNELFIIEGQKFSRGASFFAKSANQLMVVGGDDKSISTIRISI